MEIPDLTKYRQPFLLEANPDILPDNIYQTFSAVRQAGYPNAKGDCVPLKTGLNVHGGESYLRREDQFHGLLEFIQYGLPSGYIGPVSGTQVIENHPSATQFPEHIDEFIDKEMAEGVLVGPMQHTPFAACSHINPLMSRPKANPDML